MVFLTVAIYSVIKNINSLSHADTLDIYNKIDIVVGDASDHFLNGRTGAREMRVTKTYSDDAYKLVLQEFDDALEHMGEFSEIAKGRDLGNLTALTTEIVDGLKNYQSIVVSKYEIDRKRIAKQNELFLLGAELKNTFENALEVMAEAVVTQAAQEAAMMEAAAQEVVQNPDSALFDKIMQPMDMMHKLNMIVYEFVDVRIIVRNILFLDNLSEYDSMAASLQKIAADLISYREEVSIAGGIDYDSLLADLSLYGQLVAEYKDLTVSGTKLSDDMDVEYRSIQAKVQNVNSITLDNLNGIISNILVSSKRGAVYTVAIAIVTLLINILLSVMIRNSINADLMKSVHNMAETASGIRSASEQMTTAAEKLARGNTEQAASIEETSAAMSETTAMISNNNKNTEQAAHLSKITSDVSEDGVEKVNNMMNFMSTLNESSDKIGKIISDINAIASQTTILALNASIEAVRAGETGKSFSVVAEEVKNLAQQITEAAEVTTTIIEENVRLTRQGADISKGVGETLQEICENAKKVSELLREILSASTEQVQGADQINRAMIEIEKVTQLSSAVSEESASTADELQNRSVKLQEIMRDVQHLTGV